jgi:hypothetical protein
MNHDVFSVKVIQVDKWGGRWLYLRARKLA